MNVTANIFALNYLIGHNGEKYCEITYEKEEVITQNKTSWKLVPKYSLAQLKLKTEVANPGDPVWIRVYNETDETIRILWLGVDNPNARKKIPKLSTTSTIPAGGVVDLHFTACKQGIGQNL